MTKQSAVRIEVFASGCWVGFHCWPAAPNRVKFLRNRHRHNFHWKVWWLVSHANRDVEFCEQKDWIERKIADYAKDAARQTWSCEQWAAWLLAQTGAVRVEVNEDGENGAVVIQEEDMSQPKRLNVQQLTKRDIQRVEEALDTADLETMVAVVDDIVRRHLMRQQKRAS